MAKGQAPRLGDDRQGGYRTAYLGVILGFSIAVAALSYIGIFQHLHGFPVPHQGWLPEALFAGFVVGTVALFAMLVIQRRELSAAIAGRERAERRAREAASLDSLTGIPNRALFEAAFSQTLAQAQVTSSGLAILVIDIDRLLAVNDSASHAAGDEVLRQAAGRLRDRLRKEDVVARLGGDEFAVLFPMVPGQTDALFHLASELLVLLHEPMTCAGQQIRITASIGIAKYPQDGETETCLLRCAETALLQAKAAGRDRFALFDPDLDARRRKLVQLQRELNEGFERGEIVAFYQPMVDLATRRARGFEALARWRHPRRGLLEAGDFVPAAEGWGLADGLFEAMLRRVCEDTCGWPPELTVALNLSPSQLLDPSLAGRILDILAAMQVPARRIELEITETALLRDFTVARETLSALKAAGMRMSLDDFGTGYSSLRHLSELPIDKIKIDRSFTSRIADDAQRRKIIASTLRLGATLGLVTLAEGVEREEEAGWLRSQGCTLAQGYLFAHPLPPAEALAHSVFPAV